jgi:hypothetical protein
MRDTCTAVRLLGVTGRNVLLKVEDVKGERVMGLYLISLISIKESAIVAWASSKSVFLVTILWSLVGTMLFNSFTLYVDREKEEFYAVMFSKVEKLKEKERLECITYCKDDRDNEESEKCEEE